jgi:hypothetical protein
VTAEGTQAPDGIGVVRYELRQFLDPAGQFGQTVKVTWSCAACNTLVRCRGTADALHTLQQHAVQHHHRGAGRVIP